MQLFHAALGSLDTLDQGEDPSYPTDWRGACLTAFLDLMFDEEPTPPDNPLLQLDNITMTAHMAGPTFESHKARVRNAFDNVQRVNRGKAPLWIIPELMD